MSTQPAPGDLAPDFTLTGTSPEGPREFSLSTERGRPVVLAFYPADNTPGCTRQLCGYQDELDRFANRGATLWGISRQGVGSHEQFAAKRSLAFPLLADTAGTVCKAYGVDGLFMTKRSIFVIDPDGRVVWRSVSRTGLRWPSATEIDEVLGRLAGVAYPVEPEVAVVPAPKPARKTAARKTAAAKKAPAPVKKTTTVKKTAAAAKKTTTVKKTTAAAKKNGAAPVRSRATRAAGR